MNLRIQDLVALLQVSEQTILRWIEQKKIPFYKVGSQYKFGETEIKEWIINNKLKNDLQVSERIIDLSAGNRPVLISALIERGGVFYGVAGETVSEVIERSVDLMPMPEDLEASVVKESLLERESLMPTAIGHGIAVPHPRSPIITDLANESLTLGFLERPIDYGAIDGNLVHTIFIILSANSHRHLEILSKISYLAQKPDFHRLLTERAEKPALLDFIRRTEESWQKK